MGFTSSSTTVLFLFQDPSEYHIALSGSDLSTSIYRSFLQIAVEWPIDDGARLLSVLMLDIHVDFLAPVQSSAALQSM